MKTNSEVITAIALRGRSILSRAKPENSDWTFQKPPCRASTFPSLATLADGEGRVGPECEGSPHINPKRSWVIFRRKLVQPLQRFSLSPRKLVTPPNWRNRMKRRRSEHGRCPSESLGRQPSIVTLLSCYGYIWASLSLSAHCRQSYWCVT